MLVVCKRHRIRKHRRQVLLQPCGASEHIRQVEDAACGSQDGEDVQRDRHDSRGFVQMVSLFLRSPELVAEGQPQQAEHVVRGHQRCDDGQGPQYRIQTKDVRQYLILREESRQRRDPGDREGTDKEGQVGFGQRVPESSHLADILFSAHRMDHAARGKEQQCFEEGMGGEMEHGRR